MKFDTIAFYLVLFAISITGVGNGFLAPTNILLLFFYAIIVITSLQQKSIRINGLWLGLSALYTGFIIMVALYNQAFTSNFLSIVRGIFIAAGIILIKQNSIEKKIVVFGAINAIFGVMQEALYLLTNKVIVGSQAGIDFWFVNGIQLLRVEGLVGDSNTFAAYLVLPLIICFDRFLAKRNTKDFWLSIVMIGALILTASRGGLAGVAVGLILVLLKNRSFRSIFWLILIFSAFIFVVRLRIGGTSDSTRVYLLLKAIELWLNNPIFGVGPGNFGYAYGNTTAHNIVLESLSETGTFATVVLLIIVFTGLILLWKTKKIRVCIGTIGFFVSAMFLSLLTNAVFWFNIGLMFCSPLRLEREYPSIAKEPKKTKGEQFTYRIFHPSCRNSM